MDEDTKRLHALNFAMAVYTNGPGELAKVDEILPRAREFLAFLSGGDPQQDMPEIDVSF